MEVKILNEEKKEFKPIKLEITIESEEELCNLWHRVNNNNITKDNYSCYDSLKNKVIYETSDLFRMLDSLVKENNLYNEK